MSSLVILTSLRRKGMSSLARNSLVVVLLQRLGFDHSRPRSPFETGASPLGIGAEVRSVKRFGPTCTGTPYVKYGLVKVYGLVSIHAASYLALPCAPLRPTKHISSSKA